MLLPFCIYVKKLSKGVETIKKYQKLSKVSKAKHGRKRREAAYFPGLRKKRAIKRHTF